MYKQNINRINGYYRLTNKQISPSQTDITGLTNVELQKSKLWFTSSWFISKITTQFKETKIRL